MDNLILKQLQKDALYAQRSFSEGLLYQTYGEAQMARRLDAITQEEFMEINRMTVHFMNTDAEYIRRRNKEFFHDGQPAKPYAVRFFGRDAEGRAEFDTLEQAQVLYDSLDGKAEIQKWDPGKHVYDAVMFPEFEV